jgi:hypothetical protein
VTDSYISQLLTGKRTPPAPNRTDIYEKMDEFLKLPSGELATLADHQRKEQLMKELGDEPAPLFREVRALVLRKCNPLTERHIRAVFGVGVSGRKMGHDERQGVGDVHSVQGYATR